MIQVKICGLTRVDQAAACAEMGVDAIGLVFHPPSPRHVEDALAAEISRALPPETARVGVFVNESLEFLMNKVERCGLTMVQLHGFEPPELTAALKNRGVGVIKAFFANKEPLFNRIPDYRMDACLVECAGGNLPGGNAKAWEWRTARGVGQGSPLALAGGLTPDNIAQAIGGVQPDAVDVSSGVEASPGEKDLNKVKQLLANILGSQGASTARKVFI